MSENRHRRAKRIPLFIVLFVVAIAVFSFVVMSLWNWLIPDLFGGPTITMLQAIGILVLSKILFGSFNHKRHKRHCCEHHGKFRDKIKEDVAHIDENAELA